MSSPSIESALRALLLAFESDPTAVDYLLKSTAAVGPGIEAHPTIPVDEKGGLTGLGLINGLLRAATGKVLNAHYAADGKLTGFTVRQEPRKLLAIPVLVYVEPGPDNPLNNEGFEKRVSDFIQAIPGVRSVFVAEDFHTSEYEEEPDEDLTAMIGAACLPVN
jgi:hypothetical protein